jgi:hypothetical protein
MLMGEWGVSAQMSVFGDPLLDSIAFWVGFVLVMAIAVYPLIRG